MLNLRQQEVPEQNLSQIYDIASIFTQFCAYVRKLVFNGHKTRVFYSTQINRPFPSSPEPLFQNEGRCLAFDMEIIFHFHANKIHFHKKGSAPSLILKVRVFGTQKWPIAALDFF